MKLAEREVNHPIIACLVMLKFLLSLFLKKEIIISFGCPKILINFIFGYTWLVNFCKVHELKWTVFLLRLFERPCFLFLFSPSDKIIVSLWLIKFI